MFRELDQRSGNGFTVTLEWNPASNQIRLRLDDHASIAQSFTLVIDPADARLAFLDPFALLPVRHGRWTRRRREAGQRSGSRPSRSRFRRNTEKEPAEPADGTIGDEAAEILKSLPPFYELGPEWF